MVSGGQNINSSQAYALLPTSDFADGAGYSYSMKIHNDGPDTVYVGDSDHAGDSEGFPIGSGEQFSFQADEVLYAKTASSETAYIRKLAFKV
jgi:hypothetical protein